MFLKCGHEKLFVCNLMFGKDGNMVAQQIFQTHRTIYFSKLLKADLFSETIVSQTQPAFVCSDSAIITVE